MNRLSLSDAPQLVSGWKLSQALVVLLVITLCSVNALLIKQNRELKAAIARITKPPEFLRLGQQVPPFTAHSLSGQQHRVNYADSAKTVLLVFSIQCPACERVLPYWKKINEACDRDQHQIFGVSLDDATKTGVFLASNDLRLEALVDVGTEMREAYKLYLTPQTMVIDNNGKVEKIWSGVFSQEKKLEVESYFGLSMGDNVKQSAQ
jgi:peroxiredoxin